MSTSTSRENIRLSTVSPARASGSMGRASTSHLGVNGPPVSGAVSNPAYETADPLDALDQKHRKPSAVSSSQRIHRVSSLGAPTSHPTQLYGGSINAAFETVDDLDDLDRKYRKASMAQRGSGHLQPAVEDAKDDEQEAKDKYYFKKRCPTSTKVLLTLAVLFFLSTEVMVSVYLWEVYREPPPQVCHSEPCIAAGKLLTGSINYSVDPCEDFFRHACGNFQLKEAFGNRYQDMEDLVNDELVLRMNSILTDPRMLSNTSEVHKLKAAQFHQLCMDYNHTDFRLRLVEVLQRLQWPPLIAANESADNTDYDEFLQELHQHGLKGYFEVERLPVTAASSNQPLWLIREGDLPLPRHFYRDERKMQEYQTFIGTIIRLVLTQAGFTLDKNPVVPDFWKEDVQKIVQFETNLTQISREQMIYRLSVRDFNTQYPHIARYYNFSDYLHELQEAVNLNRSHHRHIDIDTTVTSLLEHDMIAMKNRDYFQGLDELLKQSDARDQAVYLGWKLLYQYLAFLEEEPDLWAPIQRFWKVFGVQSLVRWKKCTVTAFRVLPDSGLQIYADRFFSPDHTAKADSLLDKLTQTASELVNTQGWIDEEDQQYATTKFSKLKRQLPYSRELYNRTLTGLMYNPIKIDTGSFFNTLRNFQKARESFFLRGDLGSNATRFTNMFRFAGGTDYHLLSPQNSLIGVFPKNLASPFYDFSYPGFAQYATLGFTYARQLAHVVDYEWFMLNKTGIESYRPKNRTLDNYRERQGYLLEFYRNISQELGDPSDDDTLYEDIADQAGLRIAYRAYQKTIKDTHDQLFPGILYGEQGRSFNQMFFLYFAQVFCENHTPLRVKNPAKAGFSEPRTRLMAMVRNSEEFVTTFQCAPVKAVTGTNIYDIPNPPRKLRYQKDITAKRIDEWYHWFDRKPGLPTWNKASPT
ncbi:endothelin-converting enzyme 1-like [Paramacrobiotus metropolitanus]|uniref:endothelin-converting enzyme 1-like n=1 Tax=Paramacrobiotus metropolitanus TaxID=2943436 RepID=UPI002445C14A|nr:endothelin-converting enzyme 1-like [Paramacrobiotus metropolitanus]